MLKLIPIFPRPCLAWILGCAPVALLRVGLWLKTGWRFALITPVRVG